MVRAAAGVRVPVCLYPRLSRVRQLCALVCGTGLQLGEYVQRHDLCRVLLGRTAGAHDYARILRLPERRVAHRCDRCGGEYRIWNHQPLDRREELRIRVLPRHCHRARL